MKRFRTNSSNRAKKVKCCGGSLIQTRPYLRCEKGKFKSRRKNSKQRSTRRWKTNSKSTRKLTRGWIAMKRSWKISSIRLRSIAKTRRTSSETSSATLSRRTPWTISDWSTLSKVYGTLIEMQMKSRNCLDRLNRRWTKPMSNMSFRGTCTRPYLCSSIWQFARRWISFFKTARTWRRSCSSSKSIKYRSCIPTQSLTAMASTRWSAWTSDCSHIWDTCTRWTKDASSSSTATTFITTFRQSNTARLQHKKKQFTSKGTKNTTKISK